MLRRLPNSPGLDTREGSCRKHGPGFLPSESGVVSPVREPYGPRNGRKRYLNSFLWKGPNFCEGDKYKLSQKSLLFFK